MPLVSDPGFVLVQACVAAGLAVEVLPGPSAALAALVASGLPAETWRFVGFLPRKRGELAAVFGAPETLVAFESPRPRRRRRWRCWPRSTPSAPVAVCRELTKLHEEVVRGSGGRAGGALRGEASRGARSCWSSAARGRRPRRDLGAALDALRRLVDAGAKPRPAAAVVAELTGRAGERALPRADATTRRLRARLAPAAPAPARGRA